MSEKTIQERREERKKRVLAQKPWTFFRTEPSEAIKIAERESKKYCPEVPTYPPSLPTEFVPLKVPNKPNNLRDKIIVLIFGQAIGDAVGLATEFLTKEQVKKEYPEGVIDYNNYYLDKVRIQWANEKGIVADWTDDTDQFLLILDDIVSHNGEIDLNDYAKRCLFWLNFGFPELGDLCALDYGHTFGTTVTSKGFIEDPIATSKKVWIREGERVATNGCVMKTSIVALPYFWDEEKMIENTVKICQATHYDPRCVACSIVTTLIISKLIIGEWDVEKIIEYALAKGRSTFTDEKYYADFDKFFDKNITIEGMDLNRQKGYVFKPICCAIYGLRRAERELKEGKEKDKIFRGIITDFTMEAGDADTNCAVIGTILGCYLGSECLPKEWLKFDNYEWL